MPPESGRLERIKVTRSGILAKRRMTFEAFMDLRSIKRRRWCYGMSISVMLTAGAYSSASWCYSFFGKHRCSAFNLSNRNLRPYESDLNEISAFQGMARAKNIADFERNGQATVEVLGLRSIINFRIDNKFCNAYEVQTPTGTQTRSSGRISVDLVLWGRLRRQWTMTITTGREPLT